MKTWRSCSLEALGVKGAVNVEGHKRDRSPWGLGGAKWPREGIGGEQNDNFSINILHIFFCL